MSFDEEFDFALAHTRCLIVIEQYNTLIHNCNQYINCSSQLVDNPVFDNEIQACNKNIEIYNSKIIKVNATREAIEAILALTVENKTLLYELYTAVSRGKAKFKLIILNNLQSILADIEPIINGNYMPDQKQILLKHIYNSYKPTPLVLYGLA